MAATLSVFSIRALAREIAPKLKGKKLEKAQQIGEELFKLSFSGGSDLLIESGKRLNLTGYKLDAPIKASNIAMLLRKHLCGKILREISQHNFDRVIILDFGERNLIVELFAKGNLILTDKAMKAIWAFHEEKWKDRETRHGIPYEFPKSAHLDPTLAKLAEFSAVFTSQDIVRSLALNLGIGGTYAEELCLRAGVDKNKPQPSVDDMRALFDALHEMLDEPIKPSLQAGEVHPFQLKSMLIKKTYTTMSEAIDDACIEAATISVLKPQTSEKLERRLKEQEDAITRLQQEADTEAKAAKLIYENFSEVERALALARAGKIQQLSKNLKAQLSGPKLEVDLN